MNALSLRQPRPARGIFGTVFTLRVAGHDCGVRSQPVCPIDELLGFEDEVDSADGHAGDPALLADLLESRMIVPPRPRRRRERAVSSRAALYAPSR